MRVVGKYRAVALAFIEREKACAARPRQERIVSETIDLSRLTCSNSRLTDRWMTFMSALPGVLSMLQSCSPSKFCHSYPDRHPSVPVKGGGSHVLTSPMTKRTIRFQGVSCPHLSG